MTGFSWADSLTKIAEEFPDTKFAIIYMGVEKPNVKSIVFKEEEGSYLVGVMAAMASKSKKSVLSAAWIFRSSASSAAVMSAAPRRPARPTSSRT